MKRTLLLASLVLMLWIPGRAWVYPEHRHITLLAIRGLDTAYRAELDRLWSIARKGFESRLDLSVADAGLGLKPPFIDFAAWPAIAGDHSNSPENLLYNVLQTNWIMKVANVGAILEQGLRNARNNSDRINRISDSDTRLMHADPQYVSRADANTGHFMLALPSPGTTAAEYFNSCSLAGAKINLVGIYTWFHMSALQIAAQIPNSNAEEKPQLILAALADEAFALHFLEDAFSSGHVAGIWGDAAQRKGTHDYYNENGLEVTNWRGEREVLMGDGYMREEDAIIAAGTVRLSLEQLISASMKETQPGSNKTGMVDARPDTFDVRIALLMPPPRPDTAHAGCFLKVLSQLPVPGLANGLGQLPRFRSEIGPFIGIAPAARLSFFNRGFSPAQNISGAVPDLELALRIGFGMEGVLNESGDGLVFLEFGGREDGASTMSFDKNPTLNQFGSVFSAIPSRDAFYFRLHLPFFLIPGDLILATPILLFTSPETLERMLMTAGNGGLIPWQTGLITPIGRFQFVLGREIGLTFFGTDSRRDAFMMPDPATPGGQILIGMNSTQIDFPILEYRLMRTFASRQRANLVLQFNGGVDIPGDVLVTYPTTATKPAVRSIWFVGFRLAFDWRYYFNRNKS